MALPEGWSLAPEADKAPPLPTGWSLADPSTPAAEKSGTLRRALDWLTDTGGEKIIPSGAPTGGADHQKAWEEARRIDPSSPEGKERRDPIANDWGAQAIIGGMAGGAAGKLVGPVASKLGPLARFATGATEGAVSNTVQGGDPGTGALFGAAMAVPSVAARAGAKALDKLQPGARVRATKDIGRDIIRAEGPSARVTDQKRIAAVNDRLFDLTRDMPELRDTWRKPAEKALPEIQAAKQAAAAPIDGAYQAVDAKTGGVRLGDIVDGFENAAKESGARASGQAEAARFRTVKDNFLKAYGEPMFDPSIKVTKDGVTAGQMLTMLEKAKIRDPISAKLHGVDAQIAQVHEMAKGGINLDKRIPTAQFREEVTNLHKTAEQSMGGLEGSARHEALDKLYRTGKDVIDKHLDASGIPPEQLAELRKANDHYFLLSRAEAAVESRGWKEANRHTGFIAHTARQAANMSLPAAAAYAAVHPAAIPAIAGTVAASKALPAIASRANWALANRVPGATAPPVAAPTGPAALFAAARERQRREQEAAAQLNGGMR